MIAGVGWDWMFANGMASLMLLLLTAHPLSLAIFALAHGAGLAIYAKDPQQVGVLIKRARVGVRANRALWSGNSYGG